MSEPLVSIITPCYNGEKYVQRFLDSILAQTYPNIELIFINDGSTDNTEEIALSYEKKLKEKGIIFEYIFQKNAGQAAALNKGLEIFKGDYLTWPDSDDVLDKNNIKLKVEFLNNNPDKSIVLCKTRAVIDNKTYEEVGILERDPKKLVGNEDNLFEDLIFERNVYFAPGGYMVKSSDFLIANCGRKIYESQCGQNWQMLLPMSYYYQCGYLDEILYTYFIRETSHSRQEKTFEDLIKKTEMHSDCLKKTVKKLDLSNQEELFNKIDIKYIRKRFDIAVQYKNNKIKKEEYQKLKIEKKLNNRERILFFLSQNLFLYKSAKAIAKTLRKIKSI